MVGFAALALGAVLLAVGAGAGPAPILPLVALGLAALYIGASRVGRCFLGKRFDLAAYLSVSWLVLVLVAAVLADWLPLSEHQDTSKTLATPIKLRPDAFSAHPLGTDNQGLDILGGVVSGARVSITVAIGAALIGILLGGAIGMVAGYFRGRIDSVVGFFVDSTLAFPPIIMLLALATILEPSIRNMTLVLAVLSIPMFVRISRANTMTFAQREFVLASRVLGVKDRWILVRDIFPNVLIPLVSYAFIVVGALIVAEASLSFLGLGIPRPQPTWGNMIAAGQTEISKDPFLVVVPGVVLFLTVFSLNRVGEWIQRKWDPRGGRL